MKQLVSDSEPKRPDVGLYYAGELIRPGKPPEDYEAFACGCCVSLDDAVNSALQGEPVGTEVVLGGSRWRKVYGCAEGRWDDPDH